MSFRNWSINYIKIFAGTAFIFLLVSCNSDDCGCDPEIPQWLQDQIEEDEKVISSNPDLMPNFGAWFRYEFEGEHYYEYDNPLSSLSRNPYSNDGVRIDLTQASFMDYWIEKCCEKYIWSAPRYGLKDSS